MGEALGYIIQSLQYLIDFITTGLYEFVVELTAYIFKAFLYSWIQFQIWFLQFTWDVAKSFIENLSITDEVIAAYEGLDADIKGTLGALKLPDALNIILNATVTKFVLKMFGQ